VGNLPPPLSFYQIGAGHPRRGSLNAVQGLFQCAADNFFRFALCGLLGRSGLYPGGVFLFAALVVFGGIGWCPVLPGKGAGVFVVWIGVLVAALRLLKNGQKHGVSSFDLSFSVCRQRIFTRPRSS